MEVKVVPGAGLRVLLVDRPYALPGPVQNTPWIHPCRLLGEVPLADRSEQDRAWRKASEEGWGSAST